jgi:hypothetical protein
MLSDGLFGARFTLGDRQMVAACLTGYLTLFTGLGASETEPVAVSVRNLMRGEGK